MITFIPQHYISYQSSTNFNGSSSFPSTSQHYIPYQSLAKEFHPCFQPLLINPSQRNFIIIFSPSTLHFLSVPREKEFFHYSQPICIEFLISPSQRNFILTFIPSTLHLLLTSSPSTYFVSLLVPCKGILSFTFSPLMLHFQSLTNVRNFILTFNPSTLYFLSVPCNVISSFLSNPQHYISYQSLTKEFHRYFQPLIIAFLISPLQRNFTLSFSPSTLHFLSDSRRGTSTLLSDPQYYISHKSLTMNFILGILTSANTCTPQNFLGVIYQHIITFLQSLELSQLYSHLKFHQNWLRQHYTT
jgi:hypothetical protein